MTNIYGGSGGAGGGYTSLNGGGGGVNYSSSGTISIAPGPKNSIHMTDENGLVKWIPIEEALVDLLKLSLSNPTIRDRVQNAINALNNLEMTVKLVKK